MEFVEKQEQLVQLQEEIGEQDAITWLNELYAFTFLHLGNYKLLKSMQLFLIRKKIKNKRNI